ncbi:MAG: hypothetical protein IT183_00985 [Acidobacteria bacterium]|nr:hypothetical protein [Acidobacteriota bacterium]
MMFSRRWWFAAFVVVVFLAGTSVGVIVDRLWLLPRGPVAGRPVAVAGQRGPSAEAAASRIVDANLIRLRDQLGLTAGQHDAVRRILEAWLARVATLQATTRSQLLAETDRFEEELSPVLTPEQRERLSEARTVLILPATGRGRFGGADAGRGARGPVRPGGPGRAAGPGRE